MKFTFHLNRKNVCSVVAGASVVVLAYIPLAIPPDHWIWLRWTMAVLGCGTAAVIALGYQAVIQSREDAERDAKEQERDKTLAELQRSLTPQIGSSAPSPTSAPSNAITRSVPHSPGTFDSVNFFRTAYLSPLQDVGANSYITEAERVRPNDKASFYLDILAVGSIQILYDDLWWNIYRSQIRALSALNAGMLPIDEFRKPFDEALVEFADDFARLKIIFEDWIGFLEKNQLLIVHPSKMIEITLKGRDFLKYLLHHGRQVDTAKRL
jgi:hypothetical protein